MIDDEMRDCPNCGSHGIYLVVLSQCGECGHEADSVTVSSLSNEVEAKVRALWNDRALREGLPSHTRKFPRREAIDDTGIARVLRTLSEDDDDQST